jgi:2-isopropylmalate synthase
LALNLHTQGVDCQLDLHDLTAIRRVVEDCNQLPVHPRHPYVGELVFTAFSGSHQDAIRKGMQALKASNSQDWAVPYLPINPADVDRQYEPVIRINSQSGKGGVTFVLEDRFGLSPPRGLQIEFSNIVQKIADESGKELSPDLIWDSFQSTYLNAAVGGGVVFVSHTSRPLAHASEMREITAVLTVDGQERTISGTGNGPIDAFVDALRTGLGVKVSVIDYSEHALTHGSNAGAVSYMQIKPAKGDALWGVATSSNIVSCALKAIVSAVNRLKQREADRG